MVLPANRSHFDSVEDESGESNLIIQVLTQDDPRVIAVCQNQGVDPQGVAGGASFTWQDNLDDQMPNPNYAAILVDIPNAEAGSIWKVSAESRLC